MKLRNAGDISLDRKFYHNNLVIRWFCGKRADFDNVKDPWTARCAEVHSS